MRPPISKSTYMYGLQCHKRFYLNRFHKELANPLDERSEAVFQSGTDAGLLAQQLFPNGVNAQGEESWICQKTVENTAKLLEDNEVIYEAAFMFNEVICAVDILVRKGDAYYAFEVKSTNGIKSQHIEDAALQYYVLSNCGLNLKDFSIIHFDREYVRVGDINIEQLFKAESILEDVLAKQGFIAKNISDLKKLIQLKRIPDIEMGNHCNNPYPCNFSNYCNSLVERIEEETRVLNNSIQVDKPAWLQYTANIKYPLFFFDFETIQYGVPQFNFSSPYQQIPFQYSLHVLLEPNAKLIHSAYLGDGINDPRPALIEQMIRDLGSNGSIITWNMTFEKSAIKKLAENFPDYQEELIAIHDRIVDLMPPFRPNRIVYSEAFEGRYSIKKVLPVMVPDLSYENLSIQEGGTASFRYGQMAEMPEDKREQLRKDLLDYCHLDTLAMVKIWECVKGETD
ncbi:MAG: DUF2779 domain-containing protein [Bacteroidia bacterium]|nr:DUF2779 domain-containing protein [Bacteroidia bacterium]